MKRKTAIILALVNLVLTALLWWHWGGCIGDSYTLVLLMWLALSSAVIADHTKKVEKSR